MNASLDSLPQINKACLYLYRLFDVANSIDIEKVRNAYATTSTRVSPVLSRGASIDMRQLPLAIALDSVDFKVGSRSLTGRLDVRVYDIGIVTFRLVVDVPPGTSWDAIADILADVQASTDLTDLFSRSLDQLKESIEPAMERPENRGESEDYAVVVIDQLEGPYTAAQIGNHPALLRVALGERRPLSPSARGLASLLSYYEDDLILLTWNAALVIEPDAQSSEDATFLLEVANVQLLALRSYDAHIERELARVAPYLTEVRRRRRRGSGASRFLHDVHSLIVDATETSSRISNALKVTEDVYWNRVYTAALVTLRVDTWQASIDKSLEVLRETASLLADESAASREMFLEWLIVALIFVEIILAVVALRR